MTIFKETISALTVVAMLSVLVSCKVSVNATDTETDTETGTEIDPAPSGTETTEVHVFPNGTTMTMPGRDSGTQEGNQINFDTPGAVPQGSPYEANPDNTTIIYHDN